MLTRTMLNLEQIEELANEIIANAVTCMDVETHHAATDIIVSVHQCQQLLTDVLGAMQYVTEAMGNTDTSSSHSLRLMLDGMVNFSIGLIGTPPPGMLPDISSLLDLCPGPVVPPRNSHDEL